MTTSADLTAVLTANAIRLDEIADDHASAYAAERAKILDSGIDEDELSPEQWERLAGYLGAFPPLESITELASVPVPDRQMDWRCQMSGLLAVSSALALVRSGALDSVLEHAEASEARAEANASRLTTAALSEAKVDRRAAKQARKARRNGTD